MLVGSAAVVFWVCVLFVLLWSGCKQSFSHSGKVDFVKCNGECDSLKGFKFLGLDLNGGNFSYEFARGIAPSSEIDVKFYF